MKFLTFFTALLASGTGITAVELPNSTTFSIVDNGFRIELVPVSKGLADKYIEKFNSSSPGLSGPPESGPLALVCENPARALDHDGLWGATNMMKWMCHSDSHEGFKIPPYSAFSVTYGSSRISVCSYGVEIRCDAADMFAGWSTLDKSCQFPGIDPSQYPAAAGYVFFFGDSRVYQREDCFSATLCGMKNQACHPV